MTNALRAIALILEQMDNDAKGDKIADHVRDRLAADDNALTTRMNEAATLTDKATAAVESAARMFQKVTEDTTAAILEIQNAMTAVTSSVTQLSETTNTYRDVVMRAAMRTQHIPTSVTTAPTLTARVRTREGIKQCQILVDAASTGAQILIELDNMGLTKKANEVLDAMGIEDTPSPAQGA